MTMENGEEQIPAGETKALFSFTTNDFSSLYTYQTRILTLIVLVSLLLGVVPYVYTGAIMDALVFSLVIIPVGAGVVWLQKHVIEAQTRTATIFPDRIELVYGPRPHHKNLNRTILLIDVSSIHQGKNGDLVFEMQALPKFTLMDSAAYSEKIEEVYQGFKQTS